MWLSSLLALGAMWAGLALSYAVPKLPPSFAVVATAAVFYLLAALRAGLRPQRGQ